MSRLVIRYDKNENIIAVGENYHDLARQLNISPSAVSHAIHRGSKLYYECEVEEDEEILSL